jgi:hypothetical protein
VEVCHLQTLFEKERKGTSKMKLLNGELFAIILFLGATAADFFMGGTGTRMFLQD